jgi:uncharacterized protein YidB (DUF937 family)
MTTGGHEARVHQRGKKVALTDILGKTGQQGGIEVVSQLFGGHGLQGILSAMQSNGMGQQVKSWIGDGPNVPVTGADVKKVANPSALARLARQEGMSPEELCDHIAQALPGMVDKATPDGQVPRQQGKPAQDRKAHKK